MNATLSEVERIPTGIRILDERLGGGFPRPSTLLLFSDKLTEKRVFAEHFVIEGARSGNTSLYVDFFRAPQLARLEFAKFGPFPSERIVFVDSISSQVLLDSAEKYRVDDVSNLRGFSEVIISAIEAERPQRIVIDSMEFLADRFPQENLLGEWRRITDAARKAESVIGFLFLRWAYHDRDIQAIREMSDYAVEFQSTMRGGILRNTLRITQTAGKRAVTNWIPYTFRDLVGVTAYFPRILVTGPDHAGRSTVVRSLCKEAISVNRLGTTVAFDYGNVNTMGIEAELFGTPDQERFEFIFSIFAREVTGVLLVVDSSRPSEFLRARQILDLVGPNIPYVVLANKNDLPGAASPAAIAEGLRLPEDAVVIPTVATEGRGLVDALVILAEMIIGVR